MTTARIRGLLQRSFRWLAATTVILLVSGTLMLLHADASTAGIVYLVLVVWCATVAERDLSIYLAVVCGLLFDYYFLPPLFTFDLTGFHSWLSMTAFVVSCIVVGRVADQARRQTRQAEQRREDVERLYALGQEMMLHEDAAGLVREIPRLVAHNFALAAVLLYVRDEDQVYSSVPLDSSAVIDTLRRASLTHGPAEYPEGYMLMNLVFGMTSLGSLAWKPDTLSREVAASITAQVAIVITRAHAVEVSARLEAARTTDRLRSALIDSLTHELRTPLTAIRAAATTLLDGYGLDDTSRTELTTIVDEESSRLDSLIGEAMEIAEIESDGIRVKPEPLLMAPFLEQSVEQSHDQLAAHQVTIVVQQPDIPVWFDPHVIGRALRHLLENAARYTPIGSHIHLQGRRTVDFLEFLVEDEGPGIDAQDLPLIFEKFYRGKNRHETVKGSGMGLAITRALLTAHGGVIEVESVLGRGTIFRLRVPIVEKAAATGQALELPSTREFSEQ